MKMRLQTGPLGPGGLALALWLACAAPPVDAQVVEAVGPLTSQALFFDQALNAHGSNYLSAEAGIVATDNATFAPGGPSDILALLGLAADTSRQGPGLDYHLDSDLALVKYEREDLPTKPMGYLDGGAALKLIPGLLSWNARETYTDVVLRGSEPVTPENLETLNYITTGPSLTLRPTLRTTITVEGSYSYIDSGSAGPGYVDLDNHRYAGDLRIAQALSNTSSLYVTGSSQQADFRDTLLNPSFTRDDALAGFRFVNGRTIVDIAAGYDRLREGGYTPAGGAYRVELSRLISPHQRLSLHALHQPTDLAELLRLDVDQPVASSAPLQLATGSPMTLSSYGADWELQAQRTTLDVAVSDNRQRYQLTPSFNNDVKAADILLVRQLAPTVTLNLGVDFQHQDFSTGGPVRQVNALAGLHWQVGERLGLRLVYAHNALTPYGDANRVALTAFYGLIRATPPIEESGVPVNPAPAMLPTSPMSTQTTAR